MLIYLACPFRHADVNVQKKRCAAAHYTAARLSSQNFYVFSPLTHNEILMDLVPELPGEHWMQFDLAILAACKQLFVLKLEGWKESKGVQREIAFAKAHGMPIVEIDPPSEAEFLPLIQSQTSIK